MPVSVSPWAYVIFVGAVLMTFAGSKRNRKASPLASIGLLLVLLWACFGEK